MVIKLIICDMDGVIFEGKQLHYEALNKALEAIDPKYLITPEEHLTTYDGLPTAVKLNTITKLKGLPSLHHAAINRQKQKHTIEIIRNTIEWDTRLMDDFDKLKDDGYLIYVASNSIRDTIKFFLIRSGLIEYVDYFLSNEDVKFPKPNPEMYLRAMVMAGVGPDETLILEDSTKGREAAQRSGAHLYPVEQLSDVTYEGIKAEIAKIERRTKVNQKWKSNKLNVVVPMAGAGKRFEQAGFSFPKPMIIAVDNKPMIQVVVESLGIEAEYTFIIQKEHNEKFKIASMLNMMIPGCHIVETEGLTQGAACTILLAEEFINNDKQLMIANSDQYIEWNPSDFFYKMIEEKLDGGVLTFKANHTKWSYASVENDLVTRIAEKEVISEHATVGIYYWAKGSEFVSYAKNMIAKDTRVNGEFYVAPVYNEAIADGKRIKIWDVDRMMGLGVPEDLATFQREYEK